MSHSLQIYYMSLSYVAHSYCYASLISVTPLSLFIIPMSLGYLYFLYHVLTLGFAYSDSEAWNEVEPSTEDLAYLGEQADQL